MKWIVTLVLLLTACESGPSTVVDNEIEDVGVFRINAEYCAIVFSEYKRGGIAVFPCANDPKPYRVLP